eukprot:13310102-Alexandrium_andersonii.AAC.1
MSARTYAVVDERLDLPGETLEPASFKKRKAKPPAIRSLRQCPSPLEDNPRSSAYTLGAACISLSALAKGLADALGQGVDRSQLHHHGTPRPDDPLREANVPQHCREDPAVDLVEALHQ